MNGSVLLDTNIAIAILENEPACVERFGQADAVFLPVTALGEMYFGAKRSMRQHQNIKRVESFASEVAVVGIDMATAVRFGEIKAALFAKGRPIPENDIWIAAIARQHGITLVTRDAHFTEVAELPLETW